MMERISITFEPGLVAPEPGSKSLASTATFPISISTSIEDPTSSRAHQLQVTPDGRPIRRATSPANSAGSRDSSPNPTGSQTPTLASGLIIGNLLGIKGRRRSDSVNSNTSGSGPEDGPAIPRSVPLIAADSDSPIAKPDTVVTPPTPIEPPVSTAAGTIITRRARGSSVSKLPSKLSQSSFPEDGYKPLTPTIEVPTPQQTPTALGTNGGNAATGFFSNMFSAAQTAASQLSNTIANTSLAPGAKGRKLEPGTINTTLANSAPDSGTSQPTTPGKTTFSDEKERKPLAVETLGQGELSLGSLGITTPGTGDIRKRRSRPNSPADIEMPEPALLHGLGLVGEKDEELGQIPKSAGGILGEKSFDTVIYERTAGLTGTPSQVQLNDEDGAVVGRQRSDSTKSILGRRGSRKSRNRGASATTQGSDTMVPATVRPSATFAAANHRRNKDFHQLFKSVPPDDHLIEDYGCALQKEILLQGRILGDKEELVESEGVEDDDEDGSEYGTDDDDDYDSLGSDDEEDVGPGLEAPAMTKSISKKSSVGIGSIVPPAGTLAAATDGAAGATDFPGPSAHAPTSCGDESSHLDRPLCDEIISVPLGKVFAVLYGDSSYAFLTRLLSEDCKVEQLSIPGDAKFADSTEYPGKKARSFNYVKPLNASIGPRSTKCLITEVIEQDDLEKAVTVVTYTQTPDVPSGGVFKVLTRTCLMWAENNQTRIITNCTVEWSGKSWIKGPIEKGANDGQVGYTKDLLNALKREFAARRPTAGAALGAGGKGRRKRRGSKDNAPSTAALPIVPTTIAAASATQKWGMLAPLMEPITSLVGEFGAGILVTLIIVLMSMSISRAVWGDPRYGDSRSLRKSEREILGELWAREEAGLWEWLDDRVGAHEALGFDERVGRRYEREGKAMKENIVRQSGGLGKDMVDRQVDEAIRVTEERLGVLKRVNEERKGKGGVLGGAKGCGCGKKVGGDCGCKSAGKACTCGADCKCGGGDGLKEGVDGGCGCKSSGKPCTCGANCSCGGGSDGGLKGPVDGGCGCKSLGKPCTCGANCSCGVGGAKKSAGESHGCGCKTAGKACTCGENCSCGGLKPGMGIKQEL
ncbi:hypothetical protein AA313_de0210016 [Arthrobotrys entomopaga]|nr:hypothetical protein AA313_de0210016 [Arthrobotrys entomopaga]